MVLEISLNCVAMYKHMSNGFTLLELLITIFVVAILISVGVPSFTRTIQTSRMASSANDLVTSMHRARTEAVKRRVPVTLCASNNPLAPAPVCNIGGNMVGWVVFVDDADINGNGQPDGNTMIDAGEIILEAHAALPAQLTIRSDAAYVSFTPNGFRRDGPLGPSVTMVLFCDARGNVNQGGSGSAARMLMVSVTGRPQLGRDVADIAFALAQLGGTCP